MAEMSLCTSHFPVVVALCCTVLHHKPRWRHQNLKNTNSNKACCSVFAANYPQKVSKCSHSPSVFSHKIDGQHVSQAVLWVGCDIQIRDVTNVVAVGVMSVGAVLSVTIYYSWAWGRKDNLFHVSHTGATALLTLCPPI